MKAEQKFRFKGAKEIHYLKNENRKEKPESEKDYKEFWSRLFGGFRLPICPICEVALDLVHVHIENSTTLAHYIGGTMSPHIAASEGSIELKFECPKCASEVEGVGRNIHFDLDERWFSLDEFVVTRWVLNAP